MLNLYETWNRMISKTRYKMIVKNDKLIDKKKARYNGKKMHKTSHKVLSKHMPYNSHSKQFSRGFF